MKLIMLFSLLLVVSCGSIQENTYDKNKAYKKDIKITINGKKGRGMMVIPKADKYQIKVEAKSRIRLFTLRRCEGSIEAEDGWVSSNFIDRIKKRKVEMEIFPDKENEYCVWDIGAWSYDGRHSWGLVDILRPGKYNQKGILRCNNENIIIDGVGVCQNFAGMYQVVEFDEKMEMFSNNPVCKIGLPDGKKFRWKTREKTCVYGFRNPRTKQRMRLTTHGYKYIILEK